MQALTVSGTDMQGPDKGIGVISDMISETFGARWRAEAIGSDVGLHADIQASLTPGVVLTHSKMSPLTLNNEAGSPSRNLKYYLYVANQPQSVKIADGGVFQIQPQELMILSSDTPCRIVTNRAYTTSSLIVDADLFREFVPNHKGLIARRLNYPFGLRGLLQSTLDSCVAISAAGKFADAGPRLVRSFLELLAVTSLQQDCGEQPKLSTSLEIRRAQVKAYIEKYYTSPDLTISEIARQLQLSSRYLQLAFEGEELTPSEYLRKCRLDACARQLTDVSYSHRSITEIAFGNGFNSSSHFSTEFKRAFGCSPRSWRHDARLS